MLIDFFLLQRLKVHILSKFLNLLLFDYLPYELYFSKEELKIMVIVLCDRVEQ